jgi:hypothetical protein
MLIVTLEWPGVAWSGLQWLGSLKRQPWEDEEKGTVWWVRCTTAYCTKHKAPAPVAARPAFPHHLDLVGDGHDHYNTS